MKEKSRGNKMFQNKTIKPKTKTNGAAKNYQQTQD